MPRPWVCSSGWTFEYTKKQWFWLRYLASSSCGEPQAPEKKNCATLPWQVSNFGHHHMRHLFVVYKLGRPRHP